MKKSRILFGILLTVSATSSLFAAHETVHQRVFHAGSEIAIPVLPIGNYSARIAVENEAGGFPSQLES